MATSITPWAIGGGGTATAFTRHQAQTFCRDILESETYRDNLRIRAESGTLAPAIESMLWAYAYGKPAEQIKISVDAQQDFSQMSTAELAAQAGQLLKALEEAQELEAAIPAQYKVA